MPGDQEQIEAIDQALADSVADGGVIETEGMGRRTKRISPKELLELKGMLEARQQRGTDGMFYGAELGGSK